MGNKNIRLTIFLILLAGVSSFAALFYAELNQEKKNNHMLSQRIEGLNEAVRLSENKISELSKLLTEARGKIDDLSSAILTASEQLKQERVAKDETIQEINKFKNELAQMMGVKTDLEAKLKIAEEKLSNIEAQQMTAAQLMKPQGQQASERVSSLDMASTAPALEGKVLSVNPAYDFIVVNFGKMNNIEAGNIIDIFYKDKKIGQAKIEEVKETMSVAVPYSKTLIKQIKEGYKVILVRGE